MKNSISRILLFLGGGVYLLGLLAPNHYLPWPGFYNDAPCGVALGLVALSIFIRQSDKRFSIPAYHVVIFFILTIPFFQYFFGQIKFAGDMWLVFIYLAGWLIACICGYQLVSSFGVQKVEDYLAVVFVLGAFISSVLAMRQAFMQNGVIWETEIPYGGRVYANLAQPNQLASLLILGVVFLTHLRQRVLLGEGSYFLIGGSLGVAIAATQSRYALLAILLIFLTFCFRRSISSNENAAKINALVLLSVTAVFWWGWPHAYGMWAGSEGGENRIMFSDSPRLLLLKEFLNALWLHPWFGYGWNQVSFAQMEVVDKYPGSPLTNSSHNIFLDLLLWNGIPVGLAISIGIVWWLATRRKWRGEGFVVYISIALLLLHSQLEYPLQYAYFLFPLGLFMGVIDKEYPVRMIFLQRSMSFVFVSVVALVLSLVIRDYLLAEDQIRGLRFVNSGFLGEVSPSVAEDINVLTQLGYLVRFSKIDQSAEGGGEDIHFVVSRFPFPVIWNKYMILLKSEGRVVELCRELDRFRGFYGERNKVILNRDLDIEGC